MVMIPLRLRPLIYFAFAMFLVLRVLNPLPLSLQITTLLCR